MRTARIRLSSSISHDSDLYELYLTLLLDAIVSTGDSHDGKHDKNRNAQLAAEEIAQMLPSLATLLEANASWYSERKTPEHIISLQRDAWFNIVVHGISTYSELGKQNIAVLETLARYSRPLVAEARADQLESDIDLNTVLKRGKTQEHVIEQKRRLLESLPSNENDIRALSYGEVVFLNAANMVEGLRLNSGDCNKVLIYFLDSHLRSGAMGSCMFAIAVSAVERYMSAVLKGTLPGFTTPYVAQQLAAMFAGCCHRIARVQEVATRGASLIISQIPSALCQRSSLFALLDLLTVMWLSCLEQDTDEYEWRAHYDLPHGQVSVELSDDYEFRHETLSRFHKNAKQWMKTVLDLAPLDIKGLLQVCSPSHLLFALSLTHHRHIFRSMTTKALTDMFLLADLSH